MLVRVAIPIFHLQALLRALVSVMLLPNILIQMELVRTVTILGYILYFFLILFSLTCSADGESGCLTCDSGTNHRTADGTKCICATGYYDDGNANALCATCDKRCKTCNGAGENAC